MKFFAAFALLATASAVKLHDTSSTHEQEFVQSDLQADIQNLDRQLQQIQANMASRQDAKQKASLEERMDQLEREMFDWGGALNDAKHMFNKYGRPLFHWADKLFDNSRNEIWHQSNMPSLFISLLYYVSRCKALASYSRMARVEIHPNVKVP